MGKVGIRFDAHRGRDTGRFPNVASIPTTDKGEWKFRMPGQKRILETTSAHATTGVRDSIHDRFPE